MGPVNLGDCCFFRTKCFGVSDLDAEISFDVTYNIDGTVAGLIVELLAKIFGEKGRSCSLVSIMLETEAGMCLEATDTKDGGILHGGGIETPMTIFCFTDNLVTIVGGAQCLEFERVLDCMFSACIFEGVNAVEFGIKLDR